jgi:hypothetical protein
MWPALDSSVGLSSVPHVAPALALRIVSEGRGLKCDPWSHMRKQPSGTPGKKPPAPSVTVRPGDFRTLVEILKGWKPRRTDDAESGHRPKQIPARRERG